MRGVCADGAALFRASVGWKQLTDVCQGYPHIRRQLLFSAAIIWLLLFEVLASMLHCELHAQMPAEEREIAWLVAAGFYAAYLCLIAAALAPPQCRTAAAERGEQIGE